MYWPKHKARGVHVKRDRGIIPECNSFHLTINTIFSCPGVCFAHTKFDRMKFGHPIELFIANLLFCSKLYSDSEYTGTISLFDFSPIAQIVHTCI